MPSVCVQLCEVKGNLFGMSFFLVFVFESGRTVFFFFDTGRVVVVFAERYMKFDASARCLFALVCSLTTFCLCWEGCWMVHSSGLMGSCASFLHALEALVPLWLLRLRLLVDEFILRIADPDFSKFRVFRPVRLEACLSDGESV